MSAPFRHVADLLRQFGPAGPWFALCFAFGSCGWQDGGSSAAEFPIRRTYESDGVRLELSLDRESLTTAESVLLRLEIECAEDDEVEFPVAQDGIGEFALVEEARLPDRLRDGGLVVRGREYVLQPFLPGEYEVPALEVTLNESSQVSTEPVKLAVRSVLDNPQSAELRDISEPVDIPVPWWWWVVLGLALAFALAGMAWWWKRRRSARYAPRHVPPHEAALAELEALLGEDLVSTRRIQAVLPTPVRHCQTLRRGEIRAARPRADDRGVPGRDVRRAGDPAWPSDSPARLPQSSRLGQVRRVCTGCERCGRRGEGGQAIHPADGAGRTPRGLARPAAGRGGSCRSLLRILPAGERGIDATNSTSRTCL